MKYLVWLLVIINYRGGIDHIPQPNHERCTQQAAWITAKYQGDGTIFASAFCMEGQ
jgi:hypothetical protein